MYLYVCIRTSIAITPLVILVDTRTLFVWLGRRGLGLVSWLAAHASYGFCSA